MGSKGPSRDPASAVLVEAIEAAREALRWREAADIPVPLRKVAAWTGPRLPPPLESRLIAYLDEDERLRGETLERLPDGGAVAEAFLARPEGWWRTVVAEALVIEKANAEKAGSGDATRLRRLGDSLEETRRRLKAARAATSEAEGRLGSARSDAAARLGLARQEDSEQIRRLERDVEDLTARIAELTAEAQERDADVERLQVRLGKLRKQPVSASTPDEVVDLGDPLAIARSLDLRVRALASRAAALRGGQIGEVAGGEEGTVPQADGWPLPQGVSADSPRWIEWLAGADRPYWLIVDGHNVVFSISKDRARIADSLRRMLASLRRLQRLARHPVRVTVVFDSSLAGHRAAPHAVGGLDIRHADRGVLADDEIVALAAGSGGPAVAVTSDRELQARLVEHVLAVVDGRALAAFAGGA